MNDTLLQFEAQIRLIVFGSVLLAMAMAETLIPRRPQPNGRGTRWPANLGLVVISAVLARLVFPLTVIATALLAEAHGFGLLNWLATPAWAAVPLSVMVLDLAIYAQHVLFHRVPVLWRLHRMHHADLEFDVTTGVRFHPVEILLSLAIKHVVVAALGAPALGVLVFEVLLNASSMFSHGNIRLPLSFDRLFRLVMVTPDMHRVHHSVVPCETHSNFGFFLPWWDRLFGTYRAQPAAGHDAMTIGLPEFRDAGELRIDRLLLQPLRRPG
jgi:sterol desaturase/sphingolipid hydroxylase (fatty acid hydroxylase superfamily)